MAKKSKKKPAKKKATKKKVKKASKKVAKKVSKKSSKKKVAKKVTKKAVKKSVKTTAKKATKKSPAKAPRKRVNMAAPLYKSSEHVTNEPQTADVEVISYTEIVTPSTIDNDPIMNEAPEQPQSETPTDTLF